jgi:hypothetical protein
MTNLPSPDWTRRYEDLRAHTLGSLAALHTQAWALAVFVGQGMRAWMGAWQSAPSQAEEPTRSTHPCLPSLISTAEATMLLANMTQQCLGLAL